MKTELIETGALIVRAHKGTPFYEAKWRDGRKRQRKRRLGRAWLEPDPRGGWKRRRGRVCRGYLDERAAYREMARVIAEVEAEQQIAPTKREARFEDAVEAWFAHLEFEKRAKPSTLAGYRNLLAHPRPGERGQRGARIMREFAGRKLRSITTQDVQRLLAGIDREDVSARTVNIHRQLLHSIFEHARRNDVFALRDNPVAGTRKRPEEGARPIETFEPDELRAIAEAARSSLHRTRPAHGYSEETNAEWQRINEQDAALFIVAACTGVAVGRAPRPSMVRRRFQGRCPDRVPRDVCRRGVEHQVETSPHRSSRRAGSEGTAKTAGAAEVHEPHRPCLLPPRRRPARSVRRPKPLHSRAGTGRRTSAPLPRPTAYVWQPGDPAVRPCRGQGHDGPLETDHDGAIPAFEATPR